MKYYYPLRLVLGIMMLGSTAAHAQTSKQAIFEQPEKTGGVYYAYPVQDIKPLTAAPKGYEAFYISHLGRHGSRYLISDKEYQQVLDLLEDAAAKNALTPLGTDVLGRVKAVWVEAEHHGGDLSPLGVRQQRGIAERMYKAHPTVFAGNASVEAHSTTIVRCVLSMDAFCERLKELNPQIQTTRLAGVKQQMYLNHHTKEAIAYRSANNTWREEYRKFEEAHTNPDRLVAALFSDSEYVLKQVNPSELMWGLFNIATGMQNIETPLSFFDLFEPQELFDLWQCHNYKLYVNDANSSLNGGLMFENAKPLLRDMLDRAQRTIDSKGHGADLRFAHDGNIIPLALLMHLDGCYNSIGIPAEFYTAWSNFRVAPMAGNIQMVFFRKKNSSDVLVKFLMHEQEIAVPEITTDIYPYYHWADVEKYYRGLLEK